MKPIIDERFADNGAHSHWAVIDAETGITVIEDIEHGSDSDEIRSELLLHFYRVKRSCDGLNGRSWDAKKHLDAETAIEELECSQPKLSAA